MQSLHHKDAMVFAGAVGDDKIVSAHVARVIEHTAGEFPEIFLAADRVARFGRCAGHVDLILERQELEERAVEPNVKRVPSAGCDDRLQLAIVTGRMASPATVPTAAQVASPGIGAAHAGALSPEIGTNRTSASRKQRDDRESPSNK